MQLIRSKTILLGITSVPFYRFATTVQPVYLESIIYYRRNSKESIQVLLLLFFNSDIEMCKTFFVSGMKWGNDILASSLGREWLSHSNTSSDTNNWYFPLLYIHHARLFCHIWGVSHTALWFCDVTATNYNIHLKSFSPYIHYKQCSCRIYTWQASSF